VLLFILEGVWARGGVREGSPSPTHTRRFPAVEEKSRSNKGGCRNSVRKALVESAMSRRLRANISNAKKKGNGRPSERRKAVDEVETFHRPRLESRPSYRGEQGQGGMFHET